MTEMRERRPRGKRRVVLVTGSRQWTDRDRIFFQLDWSDLDLLVHGDADGADAFAAEWATLYGKSVIAMPALWEVHGRMAGPVRNGLMVSVLELLVSCGWDALVLAFPLPGSSGTAGTIRLAERAGIEVRVVEPGT